MTFWTALARSCRLLCTHMLRPAQDMAWQWLMVGTPGRIIVMAIMLGMVRVLCGCLCGEHTSGMLLAPSARVPYGDGPRRLAALLALVCAGSLINVHPTAASCQVRMLYGSNVFSLLEKPEDAETPVLPLDVSVYDFKAPPPLLVGRSGYVTELG